MITKQEMEDAWNHGPIDWLKNHSKKMKSSRKYSVWLQPYKHDLYEPFEAFVFARNQEEAYIEAKDKWYKANKSMRVDGWKLRINNL